MKIPQLISWVSSKKKWLPLHSWTLLVLTILMGVVAGLFRINGYIHHPQHARFDDFAAIYNFIVAHPNEGWYYTFFGVDAVWALVLLTWCFHILVRLKSSGEIRPDQLSKKPLRANDPKEGQLDYVPGIFLILMVLSYLLDITEGICYIKGWAKNLSTWVFLKNLAYGISALVFIYGCWKYWVLMPARRARQLKAIRVFFSSSYLSIITILLVGGILTFIPQGITVVIHWLNSPLNLFLSLILIGFLAVVVSHFPAYFEARRTEIQDRIDWYLFEDWAWLRWIARNLGVGFVYYKVNNKKDQQGSPFNQTTRVYRHHLGSLVILALMYAVLFAANATFKFLLPPSLVFLLLIFAIVYYRRLARWAADSERVTRVFYFWFVLTVVLMAITLYYSYKLGWSQGLVYFTVAALTSLLGTYISFRILRKKIFGKENKSLVLVMGFLGWVTLAIILIANFFLDFTHQFLSPVTLLLLYLINLYGLVSVGIKHVQFFYDNPTRRSNQLRFIIPLIPVLFLIWISVKKSASNDLHYLRKVAEQPESVMEYDQFIEYWKDRAQRDSSDQVFVMGTSYGGGLMADLWAMLVLNELQEETNHQLLNRTLNLSSNSGGSIGFGNYANLWCYSEELPRENRYQNLSDKIDTIGNFNHLSIDFTYMMGKDLVRQIIPGNWNGTDRSYQAMERYANYTGDQRAQSNNSQTFRSRCKMIHDSVGYYPSMVFATTGVDGSLGNCFSLKMGERQWDSVFRGISNVLDVSGYQEDSSLTYYGALSSSNRFPLFSPVASIEGEGHFVDGGYYDNSGLKNSLELLEDFLDRGAIPNSQRVRLFMINNSRSKYIRQIFKQWEHEKVDGGTVGQLSAILNTAVTIDKVSRHLEARANDYENVRIFLPLRITYDDVVGVYGGEPIKPFEVIKIIEENNRKIDDALKLAKESELYDPRKWGVVEPPTARLLSKPAVAYEQAMIRYHTDVRKQINQVKSWFNNSAQ